MRVFIFIFFIFYSNISFTQIYQFSFDGGLNEWKSIEVVGDGKSHSSWFHTMTGPTGNTPTPALKSTSNENGWMIFDSDLNCSGHQDAWLVSPMLKKQAADPLFIGFQTQYIKYYDNVYIEISYDSVQWQEIEVFSEIEQNEMALFEDPKQFTLDLSGFVQGKTDFWVAFRYVSDSDVNADGGCSYNWQIDDVNLYKANPKPSIDLAINSFKRNFYATAPNAVIPKSQIEQFGFLVDFENKGRNTATGITVEVVIKDIDLNEVYKENLSFDDIVSDSIVQNQFFLNDGFLPSMEPGYYEGYYFIISDSLERDSINNYQSFEFYVSENTFSKDIEPNRSISPIISNTEPNQWKYGNYYHIVDAKNNELILDEVTFLMSNTIDVKGMSMDVVLYEWEDEVSSGENIGDGNCQKNERTIIGSKTYILEGDENVETVTLKLDPLDGTNIHFKDNTDYLLMLEFSSEGDDVFSVMGSTMIDYGATIFRSRNLEQPRYGSFLAVGNEDEFSSIGFGYNFVPSVRMKVKTLNVGVEDMQVGNELFLAPNPTTGDTYLHFSSKGSHDLDINIFDYSGKAIQKMKVPNSGQEPLNLELKTIDPGVYFVNIIGENINKTLKLLKI